MTTRNVLLGVSNTIREDQINLLTDAEQDVLIRDVLVHLEQELRQFVRDTPPAGDLFADVRGPFQDPLQGKVWTHTVGGWFPVDRLPTESEAYRTYLGPNATQSPVFDTPGVPLT